MYILGLEKPELHGLQKLLHQLEYKKIELPRKSSERYQILVSL